MKHRSVEIVAPSRLHFGLMSLGHGPRRFGGVGVMIDAPTLRLSAHTAPSFTVDGTNSTRVEEFARRWAAFHQLQELPACRIEVINTPISHVGLGSGTQLALSVAAILHVMTETPFPKPAELSRSVGRGQRSAVGTYGFSLGGLIVERGKSTGELISPLDCHMSIPADWRFVLFRPKDMLGLSGRSEQFAFDHLPSMTSDKAGQLAEEVRLHMLAALAEENFAEFGESVFRYGFGSGTCFADFQDGEAYNGIRLKQLVDAARSLGVHGVGQSSWGPTLFAIMPDKGAALEFVEGIRKTTFEADLDITLASGSSHGARIRELTPAVE